MISQHGLLLLRLWEALLLLCRHRRTLHRRAYTT
jgi:hypothetical protein